MAEKIKLVQSGTGPQVMLTLTGDITGEPLDLMGATHLDFAHAVICGGAH